MQPDHGCSAHTNAPNNTSCASNLYGSCQSGTSACEQGVSPVAYSSGASCIDRYGRRDHGESVDHQSIAAAGLRLPGNIVQCEASNRIAEIHVDLPLVDQKSDGLAGAPYLDAVPITPP